MATSHSKGCASGPTAICHSNGCNNCPEGNLSLQRWYQSSGQLYVTPKVVPIVLRARSHTTSCPHFPKALCYSKAPSCFCAAPQQQQQHGGRNLYQDYRPSATSPISSSDGDAGAGSTPSWRGNGKEQQQQPPRLSLSTPPLQKADSCASVVGWLTLT